MIINSLVNGQIRMNDDIDKHWNVTYHLLVKKNHPVNLKKFYEFKLNNVESSTSTSTTQIKIKIARLMKDFRRRDDDWTPNR